MTEILSQEEVDALLTAISTGQVDAVDYSAAREHKTVKIYDFRRPDKFSKDHIRTLQMMHETFARLVTVDLSSKLDARAGIHVASVDQLTFEEFIRSIPNPTTLAIVSIPPLPGSILYEMDPSITFAIIDRLLGGTGDYTEMNRELTDIELNLMEDIMTGAMSRLRNAWECVVDIRPCMENIETNPQFAQIVPPNDLVVLVTLETKIGEIEGMTNLCFPYITLEKILPCFSAKYMFTSLRDEQNADGEKGSGPAGDLRFRRFHRYEIQSVEGLSFKNLVLHRGQKIPVRSVSPGIEEFQSVKGE